MSFSALADLAALVAAGLFADLVAGALAAGLAATLVTALVALVAAAFLAGVFAAVLLAGLVVFVFEGDTDFMLSFLVDAVALVAADLETAFLATGLLVLTLA
ncbi:MAG TPA: hypothetical protein VIC30_02610 [Orrella sp.]